MAYNSQQNSTCLSADSPNLFPGLLQFNPAIADTRRLNSGVPPNQILGEPNPAQRLAAAF